MHNLHTDHIMIRSELKYLIGGKVVVLKFWVLCGNLLRRFGSGLELDPKLNREFGPVANTRWREGKQANIWNIERLEPQKASSGI